MTKYKLKIPKDTKEDLFTLALRSYEEIGEILTENWSSTGYTVTVRGVNFKVPSIEFKKIPKEFLELIKEDNKFSETVEKYQNEEIHSNRELDEYEVKHCKYFWKASEENRDLLYKDLISLFKPHPQKTDELFFAVARELEKINKELQYYE